VGREQALVLLLSTVFAVVVVKGDGTLGRVRVCTIEG